MAVRPGVRLAAAALVLAGLAAAPASAQPAAPTPAAAQPQAFDIPTQPLGEALRALGAGTSLNILYGHDVVTSQRSAPVHGVMTRDLALSTMLQGTGLLYRFTGPDAALIFPPGRAPEVALASGPSTGAPRMMLGILPVTAAPALGGKSPSNFAPYGQSVQSAIDRRIEADPLLHGRAFSTVLRVRIDPDGRLHLASLQRSSGDPRIDRAIAAAVEGASAPGAPPHDMPQPIWFALESRR